MSLLEGLMGDLTGKRSSLAHLLDALFLGVPGGQNASGAGGIGDLEGLVRRFEAAGLGNIAHSWVAQGANQTLTPEQVTHVLGEPQLAVLAAQTGMTPADVATLLAAELPGIVDRLTPDGRLPFDTLRRRA